MNTVNGFLYETTESDKESKDNISTKKQWFQIETASSQAEKLYQIPCEIRNFFLTLQNCTESMSLTLSGSLLFKHLLHWAIFFKRDALRLLNFSKNGYSRQVLLWGIFSTLASDQNCSHECLLPVRSKKREKLNKWRNNYFVISHVILHKAENSEVPYSWKVLFIRNKIRF